MNDLVTNDPGFHRPPHGSAQGSAFGEVVPTADGSLTLSHPELGECYHSRSGALAEARGLYVEASGLEDAWRHPAAPVAVLDVGLGLGYNAVATLTSWLAAPAPPPLTVVSLEIDTGLVAALAGGRASWQAGWTPAATALCRALAKADAGWVARVAHPSGAGVAVWRVVVADASAQGVPAAGPAGYQFVWQDPFSPAKNPPLWGAAWFATVAAAAGPGCVLMTYSVARGVRDALASAGWECARIPTTQSEKRHWLRAVWRRPLR